MYKMTSRVASSSSAMATSTSSSPNNNTQALAFAVAALQQNNNDDVESMDDDAALRLQRSRERNREHARRTRLRKKAHLQALQVKCQALQEEQRGLKQRLEDRRIAAILLGLSTIPSPSMSTPTTTASLLEPVIETDSSTKGPPSKRAKTSSQSEGGVLSILIDGVPTTFSRRSHINWKTGLYTDVTSGHQRRLSPQHLEALRRERNRMHAKMTRDRKKCFIKTIEATIEDLENENARLRHQIENKQEDDDHNFLPPSAVTPELSATESPPTTTSHGFVLE